MLLSHTRAGAKYGETKKRACVCVFIIASMAKDMHSSSPYHAMPSWLLPAYFLALSRVLPLHLYFGWPWGWGLIRNDVQHHYDVQHHFRWREWRCDVYFWNILCRRHALASSCPTTPTITLSRTRATSTTASRCIFLPWFYRFYPLQDPSASLSCLFMLVQKSVTWPWDSKFGSFWRKTSICFSSAIWLHWEPHQVHEGHVRRRPFPCLKNEIVCGIGYILFADGLRTNRLKRRDGMPTNWSARSLE